MVAAFCRPSIGMKNNFIGGQYMSIYTKTSSGTVPISVEEDTGWLSILGTSLASADVTNPTAGGVIKYRKKNGVVWIQGTIGVKAVTNDVKLLFTMPAGFRITHNYSYYFTNTAYTSRVSRLYINNIGEVKLEWVWDVSNMKRVTGDIPWIGIDTSYPV